MEKLNKYLKIGKNERLFIQNENSWAVIYVVNNTDSKIIRRYESGIQALFDGCYYVENPKDFLSAIKIINTIGLFFEEGKLKFDNGFSFIVKEASLIKKSIPSDCEFKTITTNTLKKLKNNIPFVSTDLNREQLTKFCFTENKIVATNGRIMSVIQNDFSTDTEILIPPCIFESLQYKNDVQIGITTDDIIIRNYAVTIFYNKTNTKFLQWKRVIPNISKYQVGDIYLSLFDDKDIFNFIKNTNNTYYRVEIKDGSVICNNSTLGSIGNVLNGYLINANSLKETSKLLGSKIKCYYGEDNKRAIYFENENKDFTVIMPLAF